MLYCDHTSRKGELLIMLYLKSKITLLLSVLFLMITFFSAVFQCKAMLLVASILTVFFALMHVKYDFAYIDYERTVQEHTVDNNGH